MAFSIEELQQDISKLSQGLLLQDQYKMYDLHEEIRLKYTGYFEEFSNITEPYDTTRLTMFTSSRDTENRFLQAEPPVYSMSRMKTDIGDMAGILRKAVDKQSAQLLNIEEIKKTAYGEGEILGRQKVLKVYAKRKEHRFQAFTTFLLVVSLVLLAAGTVFLAILLFNIADDDLNKIATILGVISTPVGLIGSIILILLKKVFGKDFDYFFKKTNKKYQKYEKKFADDFIEEKE